MKLKNLLLLMMVTALLIAPSGCIFSPDDGGGDDPVDTGLPFASTPDILMSNFREIYTGMLVDEFRDMLHENYKTILLNGTLDEWGWEDGYYFDYTEEVNIHTNMFGGEPGFDADGNKRHPIDKIDVDVLEPLTGWSATPSDDLLFGEIANMPASTWANYRVDISFWDADLSHRWVVQQQVNFYVTQVQENGRTKYLMLGQRGFAAGE